MGPNAILLLPLTLITLFCFGYIFAQSEMSGSATVSQHPSKSKTTSPKPLPMAKQQDLPKLSPATTSEADAVADTATPATSSNAAAPQGSSHSTAGLQAAVPNNQASASASGRQGAAAKPATPALNLLNLRDTVNKILP